MRHLNFMHIAYCSQNLSVIDSVKKQFELKRKNFFLTVDIFVIVTSTNDRVRVLPDITMLGIFWFKTYHVHDNVDMSLEID